MGWAIALHGGAGSLKSSSDMPSHEQELARTALRHCLDVGTSALQSSRSALDAVELVVRALEDDQIFNAGKGSVLTEKGTVEMEASIMDGTTKLCGAASGLSTVVNPISLARLVMEKSPHVYLAFDGAEQFAKLQGVETADASYFITQQNVERLQKAKAANSIQLDYAEGGDLPNGTSNTKPTCRYVGGTVGCVAVDSKGHCAAATSTGGVVNKMVGRIGDSPIIGAGTYANQVCAVSATGKGEHFIRATVGKEVAALVEYKGLSVKEAVLEVVDKQLQPGTGGVIAVSNTGEICMHFNTSAMFRACADESGYSHVAIWH